MTDCLDPEVRDALPGLALGQVTGADRVMLEEHVESCTSCRAELAILREVHATAPIAPPLDIARIVAALPAPEVIDPALIDSPEVRKRRMRIRPVFWQVATAALLVIGGTIAVDRVAQDPDMVIAPIPGGYFPGAEEAASLSLVAGVQYLSDEEVETLIAGLESIDAVPSAEPEQDVLRMGDVEASE